jgi:hypothetical protein
MLNTARPNRKARGTVLRRALTGLSILSVLASTAAANAEPTPSPLPRLGMDPGEPQARSAPPSVPFGLPPTSQQFVLDFHGYLQLPLRMGVLKRTDPSPGQSDTALHTPPLVPQNLRRFQYTGALPDTWAQLNFTYGNSTIAGTVILAARALTDATGLFNPAEQLGANDAFLTLNLSEPAKTPLQVRIGAMTGRYGNMGAYDSGRYGTPIIARTNSIGENIAAAFKLGQDFQLALEQGFGGQLGRPPRGLVPAGWNDFADPNVGASFVNHVHAGLAFRDKLQLGLHYFTALSQDDQVTIAGARDGRISVLGGDVRLTAGRFGHLYLGAAHTQARDAGTVSGVIEVLNARGGPELIDEYLGPNSGGNGALTVFGGQYDLSLARAAFGDLYQGKSADVLVSLFGVGAQVKSDDEDFDGRLKLKGGAEVTYNMLSWFGVSTRFDHVRQNSDNAREAFTVLSPRVLFHTGWRSRDELSLQYSHFLYGSQVVVERGYPARPDPSVNPDRHVFALTGTFWW